MKAPQDWPTRIDWLCLIAAAWPAVLLLAAEEAQGATRFYPGDAVTFIDAGRSWCARVFSVAAGPDAGPWAWITINADPRRAFHVPLADLKPGCGA